MWELSSRILILNAGKPRILRFETSPDGQNGAIVLIEDLGGDGEVEVGIEGLDDTKNLSRYGRARLFISRVRGGAGEMIVHLHSRITRYVRVTVARFVGYLRGKFKRLPCKLCKELVLLILSAALAKVGVAYLAGTVVDLTGVDIGALEKVIDAIVPDWAHDFGLTATIRSTLKMLNWLFELNDGLAEMVCRALRYCPKAA